MTEKSSDQTLTDAILEITKKQKPETVRQLTEQVRQQFPSVSEKEILDAIIRLQNDDKIHVTQKQASPTSLTVYLKSGRAAWYWFSLAMTVVTVFCVLTIPEDSYPFVIVRYVLGAIFVLWLPGYTFIKALFPPGLSISAADHDLDIVERIALSLGMSLALVAITGLLLNYTQWGIRLVPIILSLTALTLTFATAATIREYQSTRNSTA